MSDKSLAYELEEKEKNNSGYAGSFGYTGKEESPYADVLTSEPEATGSEKSTELKETEKTDPEPELTSDVHQLVKKYSGTNSFKVSLNKMPLLGGGGEFEASLSFALLTGRSTKGETKAFYTKLEPKVQAEFKPGGKLNGVLKSGFEGVIAEGYQQIMHESIQMGLKLFIEGPSIGHEKDLKDKEKELKRSITLVALKLQGIGRYTLDKRLTFDVVLDGTVKIKPEIFEQLKKKLPKGLKKGVEKLSKGEILQKAMQEAGKAQQKLLQEQIEKQNKCLIEYINKCLRNPDEKIAKKQLQQLDGIGKQRAEKIWKKYGKNKKGISSLDDLAEVKGIKDKVLAQVKNSKKIGGEVFEKGIAEMAEESVKLTDDLAKMGASGVVNMADDVALKAGKKALVREVAEKVAQKLGLKVLGRIALRLIPFVNIAMFLWDIGELGYLIYKVSQASGQDGGSDSILPPETKEGENSSSSVTESNETEIIETDKGEGKKEGEGKSNISKAVLDQLEKAPVNTRLLWDSIISPGQDGQIREEHIERFLAIVPEDLTDAELQRLLTFIVASDRQQDPHKFLDSLEKVIQSVTSNQQEEIKESEQEVDEQVSGNGKKVEQSWFSSNFEEAKNAESSGSGSSYSGALNFQNESPNPHHKAGSEAFATQVYLYKLEENEGILAYSETPVSQSGALLEVQKVHDISKEGKQYRVIIYSFVQGVNFYVRDAESAGGRRSVAFTWAGSKLPVAWEKTGKDQWKRVALEKVK